MPMVSHTSRKPGPTWSNPASPKSSPSLAAAMAPQTSDQLDFQESAASLYGQTGNTHKSEELYNDILRQQPKRSSAWVGLGNNALTRGDAQQALNYYQKAYQADTNNFVASYNLMLIYQSLGKLQMAAQFRDISRKLQSKNQVDQ